jgi:amidase
VETDPGALCLLPAVELARRLRAKEISARELIEAHLRQIERWNPLVNAIVTLTADQALKSASDADERLARGEPVGPLHGLPVVHKDLFATRGVRTTKGSPIFADWIPDYDELPVARMRVAGAIMLGKSNTPEFGAGSQTFNAVFGATRNPYDLSKTCGGSSGGSAVALATGMASLADGSDVGGSLRNPASFCNVVGLRPSAGRVPGKPGWPRFDVYGPMGRTVGDVALLLSVMAGPDPVSPLSIDEPGDVFRDIHELDLRGVRVAWTANLGGLPVERRVTAALERQRTLLVSHGCDVEEAAPDLADAGEIFHVLRALLYETDLGPIYDEHPDMMKDTVRWNIEEGRRLTGSRIAWAERARTALQERVRLFFQRFDFLVCPVAQVLPFSVDIPYPTEIDGRPMASYFEWMRSCTDISVTGHPALSLPAGFSDDGLPVGMQIVGRWRGERALLAFARAVESARG